MPAMLTDPAGRGPGYLTYIVRGVATLVVLSITVATLILQGQGKFRSSLPVIAHLTGVGDGLPAGADVKVRDILVGRVDSVRVLGTSATRQVEATLDITPQYANQIPGSAHARVVPSNIFGAPSIQLVGADDDRSTLRPGAEIPADNSAAGLTLQTAFTTLQRLLNAVQPSQLNDVLTALAQAFSGRGAKVGQLAQQLDEYLGALNGQRPAFETTLADLSGALGELQQQAPDLLDNIDAFLVTSRTLTEKSDQIAGVLAGTRDILRTAQPLITGNADALATLFAEGARITQAVAPSSGFIAPSLLDLGKTLKLINDVLRNGLKLDFTFVAKPFGPYTSSSCPRYGGLAGPNCSGAK